MLLGVLSVLFDVVEGEFIDFIFFGPLDGLIVFPVLKSTFELSYALILFDFLGWGFFVVGGAFLFGIERIKNSFWFSGSFKYLTDDGSSCFGLS